MQCFKPPARWRQLQLITGYGPRGGRSQQYCLQGCQLNQSINHEFNNRLTNRNHTIEIYNGKTNCEGNNRVKSHLGTNIIQPTGIFLMPNKSNLAFLKSFGSGNLGLAVWHFLAVFSERELKFTFAICHRPSVCRLSVTFVRPTQTIEIFGNVSTP